MIDMSIVLAIGEVVKVFASRGQRQRFRVLGWKNGAVILCPDRKMKDSKHAERGQEHQNPAAGKRGRETIEAPEIIDVKRSGTQDAAGMIDTTKPKSLPEPTGPAQLPGAQP